MIGATFKLGFEDSAVRRGLGSIGGMVGRIGRQMGIGMAQRVGHQVTDLMGRIIMAAPQTLMDTMEWAGGLTDMSTQTGVAVKDLILFEEKLRLAGVQARDTSRIVSTLADSIYEATRMDSPDAQKVEAFGLLKITPEDLDFKKTMEVFDLITDRIRELGPNAKQLEVAMGDIFGAKIGYQLLRYAKDSESITAQAINNVGALSEAVNKSANDIDRFGDAMGRFENFKKSLSTIFLEEFFRLAGADSADAFFNAFDPEKLRPMIASFGQSIKGLIDQIASGQFSIGESLQGLLEKMGESIGAGIKRAFTGDGSSKLSMLGALFGSNSPRQPSQPSKLEKDVSSINSFVERISKGKLTTVFGK